MVLDMSNNTFVFFFFREILILIKQNKVNSRYLLLFGQKLLKQGTVFSPYLLRGSTLKNFNENINIKIEV